MRYSALVFASVVFGVATASCGGGGGGGGDDTVTPYPGSYVADGGESSAALTASVQNLSSVSVVEPTSGVFVVQATCVVRHDYSAGSGSSLAEVYLSTSPSGQDNPVESRLPGSMPTGLYGLPLEDIAVFAYSGPSATYYLNAIAFGSQAIDVVEARFVARFYPAGAPIDAPLEASATLTGAVTSLTSASVAATSTGTIVAEVAGDLRHDVTGAGLSLAEAYVSASASGQDNPVESRLPSGVPIGLYGLPFSDTGALPVSAGPTTTNLNGVNLGSYTTSVVEGRMFARFVPSGSPDYELGAEGSGSLGAAVAEITRVRIRVPEAGFVLVRATGIARHTYASGGGISSGEVYLSTSPTGQDNPVESRLPAGLPAGLYGLPFADIAVFPVTRGTWTFYLNGFTGGAQPIDVLEARLMATFFLP